MNTTIQVRVSEKTKKKAKKTLERLGLNLSSGVQLFLEQVNETQSIPFMPITSEGLKLRRWKEYQRDVAWAKKHGRRYDSAEELLTELDAD